MVLQAEITTFEDYLEFINHAENEEVRFEFVKGRIETSAPSSTENTVTATRISAYIFNFTDERDLGYVSGADGGYTMANGNVRLPDVGFISKERYPALKDKVFPFAPDLAVEVVSENDSAAKVRDKVYEYLLSGTKLVWVTYCESKGVDVWRLTPDGSINIRTLRIDEVLDAEDVIPSFRLPIRKIFPE